MMRERERENKRERYRKRKIERADSKNHRQIFLFQKQKTIN